MITRLIDETHRLIYVLLSIVFVFFDQLRQEKLSSGVHENCSSYDYKATAYRALEEPGKSRTTAIIVKLIQG